MGNESGCGEGVPRAVRPCEAAAVSCPLCPWAAVAISGHRREPPGFSSFARAPQAMRKLALAAWPGCLEREGGRRGQQDHEIAASIWPAIPHHLDRWPECPLGLAPVRLCRAPGGGPEGSQDEPAGTRGAPTPGASRY